MVNPELVLLTKEFSVPLNAKKNMQKLREVIKDVISELTDCDYNGENGEEYYENGRSKLDNHMDKIGECIADDGTLIVEKLIHFIEKAIYDSCANDNYYIDIDVQSHYHIAEYRLFAVIAVAQMIGC